MNKKKIDDFAKIPQPPRESMGFLEELKKPLFRHFQLGRGGFAGACAGCFASGADCLTGSAPLPETALASLRRILAAKGIAEKPGTFPICFQEDASFVHEEYRVAVSETGVTVSAADEDGFRRGIYFLEDRIREAAGKSVMPGDWRRKPFIKHRISRCFFGPTNRPPHSTDELLNDVNYYPENYLDRLAHEGINALWLTMYFKDLPSSIFPNRGGDAAKRLAKLALTVERCARYGIRIFLFFSEPKYFGNTYFSVPFADAANHPEVIGAKDKFGLFCISSETGKKYIEESVGHIFSAVPKLGGIINIMLGEDNGTCVSHSVSNDPLPAGVCPVCAKRDSADIYREYAECFTKVMHRYNPDAEFIGWFYAPGQQDGSPFMQELLHIASHWPEDATIMFNFESGGKTRQLGKERTVADYSLAFIGPSELFARSTELSRRIGAKLQVGCSHEDASVPFIPVPENLYEKYRFMHTHGVSSVMQCWYFGNYPGLMNKAAGELSFEPFFSSCEEFLLGLARPDWQNDAPDVVQAWNFFSEAYRMFPANILFAWYGPLHNSIVWPWHLFPVDAPLAPSWILKQFPEVSGDRIGECMGYLHSLPEVLTLCTQMSDTWRKGLAILQKLRPHYLHDSLRLADIVLAEAIGLQMKSTVNLLRFYSLREDMFYCRKNHIGEMIAVTQDEINNTRRMKELCESDSRLGYHPEAEGYLFFPEKLTAREELLNELLTADFPKFRLTDEWIDAYTGKKDGGRKQAVLHKNTLSGEFEMGCKASWSGFFDDDKVHFYLHNVPGKVCIKLAPCRLWPPLTLYVDSDASLYVATAFWEAHGITADRYDATVTVDIPLKLFDGFRRKGFPMLLNISGRNFHWVSPQPWSGRLCYGEYNPAGTGWLILE